MDGGGGLGVVEVQGDGDGGGGGGGGGGLGEEGARVGLGPGEEEDHGGGVLGGGGADGGEDAFEVVLRFLIGVSWEGGEGVGAQDGEDWKGIEGVGWQSRRTMAAQLAWSRGKLVGENFKGTTHNADASDAILSLGSLSQHDIGFVLRQVKLRLFGTWFRHVGAWRAGQRHNCWLVEVVPTSSRYRWWRSHDDGMGPSNLEAIAEEMPIAHIKFCIHTVQHTRLHNSTNASSPHDDSHNGDIYYRTCKSASCQ